MATAGNIDIVKVKTNDIGFVKQGVELDIVMMM
jgi:hypothetical protein